MNATGIECDISTAKKNDLSIIINNYDKDFASFATCRFSIFATIFGHL